MTAFAFGGKSQSQEAALAAERVEDFDETMHLEEKEP